MVDDPSVWSVLTDVAIPAASILVPTGIALALFRRERLAAAEDRAQARAEKEADRLRDALEEMLGHYAWFTTADPWTSDFDRRMQAVTAVLMLLQTFPEKRARLVTRWLAVMNADGGRLISEATDAWDSHEGVAPPGEDEVISEPVNRWAGDTGRRLARWMSGDVSDTELDQEATYLWDRLYKRDESHPTL